MAYRVLIVDDSAMVRSILRKTLAMTEIETSDIFEAADGEAALKLLENEWVDLAFADLNMPGMGGEEMLKQMSKNGLLKDLPVILVSAEGSEARIARLREMGVAGYVRKPFRPETVRKAITAVMEHNHAW